MKRTPVIRLVLAAALVWFSMWQLSAAPAPLDGIAKLKAGNATFAANPEAVLPIDMAQRLKLAKGQSPFATVLSCADSRVPPEVVFHTGLGELFVIRAAGEVTDHSVLASIEYGSEHLNIPLIVVMGHEFCGAVKAAIETPAGTSLGHNLDFLIGFIKPAVAATADVEETGRMKAAILANVDESMRHLLADSEILRHMFEEGKLTLVGAYYELLTGRVTFGQPRTKKGIETELK